MQYGWISPIEWEGVKRMSSSRRWRVERAKVSFRYMNMVVDVLKAEFPDIDVLGEMADAGHTAAIIKVENSIEEKYEKGSDDKFLEAIHDYEQRARDFYSRWRERFKARPNAKRSQSYSQRGKSAPM